MPPAHKVINLLPNMSRTSPTLLAARPSEAEEVRSLDSCELRHEVWI
jgi:hypothetical protein